MVLSRHKSTHKGRGAVSNPAGRFETEAHEQFDDGWDSIEAQPDAPDTELRPDPARSIISRNQSPDIPFSASINPYRGCEHGCVYWAPLKIVIFASWQGSGARRTAVYEPIHEDSSTALTQSTA